MYPDNKKTEPKDFYFAFVEGEDEQGNPIYSEPRKLDVKSIEIKEEY